jgi:hypothetical protein
VVDNQTDRLSSPFVNGNDNLQDDSQTWALVLPGGMNRPKHLSSKVFSDFEGNI